MFNFDKIKKAAADLVSIIVSVVLISALVLGIMLFLSSKVRNTAMDEINNTMNTITGIAEANRNNTDISIPGGPGGPINPDDEGEVPSTQVLPKFNVMYSTIAMDDGEYFILGTKFTENTMGIYFNGVLADEGSYEIMDGKITLSGSEEELPIIISADQNSFELDGMTLVAQEISLRFGEKYYGVEKTSDLVFLEGGLTEVYLGGVFAMNTCYYYNGNEILFYNGTDFKPLTILSNGDALIYDYNMYTLNGQPVPYNIFYKHPYYDGEYATLNHYVFFDNGAYGYVTDGVEARYEAKPNSYTFDGTTIKTDIEEFTLYSKRCTEYEAYSTYNNGLYQYNALVAIATNNGQLYDFVVKDGTISIELRNSPGHHEIKSIRVPVSVRQFYCDYMTNLTDIYYEGSEDDWNATTFTQKPSQETLNAKGITLHFNA